MAQFFIDFFNAILNYDPEATGTAKATTIADFINKVFAFVYEKLGI